MDQPATTLCERCSLLSFDDLAAGCREVVDDDGQPRLSFEDAKVQWLAHTWPKEGSYKVVQLRWHLVDSIPNLPQLSRSSQAGCDFCNFLRLSLERNMYCSFLTDQSPARDGPIYLTAYLLLCEDSVQGLVVELVFSGAGGAEKRVRLLFPVEASPGCQRWLRAEPSRPLGYLTSENTSEICRLLAECTANCHPWKASFLPTRLIDVGTGPFDVPRLVLSSEIHTTAETKYAALSYCWGDKEQAEAQLTTETTTLGERLKRIPYEIMTPAIKDGVQLTKAIGLRYIWIDALCIIQDDVADWSYESGQMDRVYHSAFVTFCGLVSHSCQEPFLQRGPAVTVPFQSTIRPAIKGHLSVRLQGTFRDLSDHNHKTYSFDASTSKWGGRAWTYQEERLSTRLLFFGASRMHFRCGTHGWSEGDDGLSRLDESFVSIHDHIARIRQGISPASSLYEKWDTLVKDYQRRAMTHDTDRLPAISGLAHLVAPVLGDQYLAGLWKGDILNGLAWARPGPETYGLQNHLRLIREREYVAPTWSWASDRGAASTGRPYTYCSVPECTILDCAVTTDPQNIFGRVHGGYLRIRGKMSPVPAMLLRAGSTGDCPMATSWMIKFDGTYQEVVAWLDWIQSDREEQGLEDLVMLLVDHQRDPRLPSGSTREPRLRALVLYPTKTPNEYYRVGLVHSNGKAAHDLMWSWFDCEGSENFCTIV